MADTKISALTAAAAAAGANELAINEAGTSKKLTVTQLAAYIAAYAFSAIGLYAPGTFTIPTGGFALMTKRLVLTSTQRATLVGTARLRVN